MPASLIVLQGKKQFTLFLDKKELLIGRDPLADLSAPDNALSRRHAMIVAGADGSFLVRDLDSKNGTLVNGLKVKEKELNWGDRIAAGPMTMVFFPAPEPSDDAARRDGSAAGTERARQPKTMGVNVNDPDLSIIRKPRPHHVSSLHRIGALSLKQRSPTEAADAFLDAILTTFKASRAAILAFGAGDDKVIESAIVHTAKPDLPKEIEYRQDILKLVRSTGRAFLQEEDYSSLYIPIPEGGQITGTLYVDTFLMTEKLSEEDLWVLSAIAIQYASLLESLRARALTEQQPIPVEEPEEGLIAESPRMKKVTEVLELCAKDDRSVVLLGEPGTGKYLIARTIHRKSARSRAPFIGLNLAGLKPEDVESVVFGLESPDEPLRKGAVERADAGTLFLEEIGTIDLLMQLKLARLISTNAFRRVGGSEDLVADVRLVFGTSKPLQEMLATKAIRENLYQAIRGVEVPVPSLRDRVEDMPLLADHFVRKFAARVGKRLEGLEPEAVEALKNYTWPGNVRELQNLIEHAVMVAAQNRITLYDVTH